MKKWSKILAVFLLAGFVSAEDGDLLTLFSILGILFGVLSISYTFKRTQAKNGLEARIKRNKKIILKQREEIQENKKILRKQGKLLEGSLEEEVEKIKDKTGSQEGSLRRDYWDKMESKAQHDEKRMKALKEKQNRVKEKLKILEKKKEDGDLDEIKYKEKREEYQDDLEEIQKNKKKIRGAVE